MAKTVYPPAQVDSRYSIEQIGTYSPGWDHLRYTKKLWVAKVICRWRTLWGMGVYHYRVIDREA